MAVDQRTAFEAMLRLGNNTDLEFIKQKTNSGPLFKVMVLARADAIDALTKLVNVPPTDAEPIRILQNEVQRFVDLVAYTLTILRAADEALGELRAMDEDDASAVRELIETEGA